MVKFTNGNRIPRCGACHMSKKLKSWIPDGSTNREKYSGTVPETAILNYEPSSCRKNLGRFISSLSSGAFECVKCGEGMLCPALSQVVPGPDTNGLDQAVKQFERRSSNFSSLLGDRKHEVLC